MTDTAQVSTGAMSGLPKFDGDKNKYILWETQFKAYAGVRKFDLALETDADLPSKKSEISADEETKKKQEEAIKRNNLAMHSLTIALNYSRGILHIKAGFKSKWDETGQQGLASDVMKSLKKKFIGRNVHDQIKLLDQYTQQLMNVVELLAVAA